jgi:hypothetical protein
MPTAKRSIEMGADTHSKKRKINENAKDAEQDQQGNRRSTSKSAGESNRNTNGRNVQTQIQAFLDIREGFIKREASSEERGIKEEATDDEYGMAHIQEAGPSQQPEFEKRKRGRPRKNEIEKERNGSGKRLHEDNGMADKAVGQTYRGRLPHDKALDLAEQVARPTLFAKGSRNRKVIEEDETEDELVDPEEEDGDEEYMDSPGVEDNHDLDESGIDDHQGSDGGEEIIKNSVVAKGKQKEVMEDSESPITSLVVYDEYWNEEDEEELQEGWSEEDGKLVKKDETEVALWKKTLNLFRQPPQELLGTVPVDTSLNKKSGSEENKNWPHDFCIQLGNVVCCVAFKDRPEYFRYVLRLVLALRLGPSKGFKEPSKKSMNAQRNRKIIEGLKGKSRYRVDEEALNTTLNEQLGPDLPPHTEFLKELRKTVGKTKQNRLGLIKSDLVSIIKAWDTYAEGAKALGLMSMVEYRKDWDEKIKGLTSTENPAKKYSTVAIEDLMKDRILAQRRAAIRQQRVEGMIMEQRYSTEERDQEGIHEGIREETPRESGLERNHQEPSPILGSLSE